MIKKLFAFVIFSAAIGTQALASPEADSVPQGGAGIGNAAACPNPGVYTGTSENGSFQEALDDAIANAANCAGCCDMRVTWELIDTDGREGGFIYLNEVNVDILASW